MLSSLHIENIAVIKSADIDFTGGFTVLTGQTGAGKSIIIDSINLICGAKQSRELIRNGEDSAEVSAVFTDISNAALTAVRELGVSPDEDGVLMFSRTLTTAGKSTARANGRVIPLSLMREAMAHLIGIHGQHDNMALLVPDNHIGYLDKFALVDTELAAYRESYAKLCELERGIAELQKSEREKTQRLEFLRFQIDEIEAVKLKPDEEEKLLARRKKLQNSEKILELSEGIYSLIYQNEKGNAAMEKCKRASRALEALAPVMPDADLLISRLDTVIGELEDIALAVDALRDDESGDPTAELDRVETRLDAISKLERKYGDSVADVLTFLEKAKAELENIEMSEEKLAELQREREALMPTLRERAEELSKKRNQAADQISERIVSELAYLDMDGVLFECALTRRAYGDGNTSYGKNGIDDVEFLISTNKGEPPKPLAKIASGGELSRIMLAIKSVLFESDGLGTLIFDEVDTGVSGKTSEKIGIKLRELAKKGNAQVLCVTHAAQIAARADNHYLIEKRESGERVSTTVTPLDRDGRINEVARIMGGINITETLIKTATEMIDGG